MNLCQAVKEATEQKKGFRRKGWKSYWQITTLGDGLHGIIKNDGNVVKLNFNFVEFDYDLLVVDDWELCELS